jgi:hypothetical protein
MVVDISTSHHGIIYSLPRSPRPMVTPFFTPTRPNTNRRKTLHGYYQNESED